MLTSSFAVLALSAAVANPFTNLVHMHPRPAQADTRINLVLYNSSPSFRDVTIDGKIYTVSSHHTMEVKAPAGTVVYAGSPSFTHKRGDAILQVTPKVNHQQFNLD
jgi:hypothetical protein